MTVACLAEYAPLAARLAADQLRVDLAIDAIGLDGLDGASAALVALGACSAELGVPLEVSPIEAGASCDDWIPTRNAAATSADLVPSRR
jgi:hypothetical protein